jgi:hypothetical protein
MYPSARFRYERGRSGTAPKWLLKNNVCTKLTGWTLVTVYVKGCTLLFGSDRDFPSRQHSKTQANGHNKFLSHKVNKGTGEIIQNYCVCGIFTSTRILK